MNTVLEISDAAETLLQNRQAFKRYNEFKINRTLQTLSPKHQLVFNVLPRLLHLNQENLPGFVDPETPYGIFNYTLTRECRMASEILFREQIFYSNENLNPFIHSLLLIGSMGSIAHTEKSDLDYTILISKSLTTPEGLKLFKAKLEKIEKWTWNTFHLETHFFINDIEDIRANNFGESDSENTGSALAKLLKEEMYRTGIIVAGKIPFWMIVPVQTNDDQYRDFVNQVESGQSLLHQEEFVDMGNVDDISEEEFFGGSIWTLIKSFKSPFKTLMKMGLLEDYMFRETQSNLLCHQVKRMVFDGNSPMTIDPYLLLFKRVEAYFIDTKALDEVDILRTAFYLKVGTQVTGEELENGSTNPKKTTLIQMIKEWGWTRFKLEQLNDYNRWQMMQKVSLGARVNKILMTSYRNMSEKNQSLASGKSLINERDTHLLGRKLFSFYRKAPNKVDNLYVLVDGHNAERELTFLLDSDNPRDEVDWYLIRGKTLGYVEQIPKDNIIKKASTLQYLAAFAGFNNLYDKNTKILLRAENQSIKEFDLHILLSQISGFLNRVNIASLSNQDLQRDVEINQLYMIIDFGYPLPREVHTGNLKDCKSPAEASKFINHKLEIIQNVTVVYLTSWGELFCKTFAGMSCLPRCLNELSKSMKTKRLQNKNSFKVYIPSGRKEILQIPWLNQFILKTLLTRGHDTPVKRAS